MRRVGNLWQGIVERGNLLRAFHQAAKGKRHKQEVREFALHLDANLDRMREQLLDRTFETGQFHVFRIRDPKERTIHAARFPERVFHHALMNFCEPALERQAIHHSYACRKGKGRLAAIAAARKAARRSEFYLKLDIRKYFDSIPHDRLLGRLKRHFKDPDVLYWFEKILHGHRAEVGRGLPIGNLTSQHFANFYLNTLDRFCERHPAVSAYCRYMDDFVCWGNDRQALRALGCEINSLVEDELGLALKHSPNAQAVARGMDFLGYRIFTNHVTLNRRSKVRYGRRLRSIEADALSEELNEQAIQQRLTAATAFLLPASSFLYRQATLGKFWSAVIGHQPGVSRRQLEQQRQQQPSGEPQQQQPDEHEQQHRVPGAPQLRPQRPKGRAMSMGLNRLPTRSQGQHPRDKHQKGTPDLGRPAEAVSKTSGCHLFFLKDPSTHAH